LEGNGAGDGNRTLDHVVAIGVEYLLAVIPAAVTISPTSNFVPVIQQVACFFTFPDIKRSLLSVSDINGVTVGGPAQSGRPKISVAGNRCAAY
jgi:hypothetical protein